MLQKSMGRFSITLLKDNLTLTPAPAPPPDLVPAGVLAPLFVRDSEVRVLFTQRTLLVKDHRGQIAFPGGVRDAGDPDLLATALRETQEEIGLDPGRVEVLGSLKPIATITGYGVSAFVGLIPFPYEFRLNRREVKRLLFLPLEGFCAPALWSAGDYTYRGRVTRVCTWNDGRTVIWGATARLLLNLLEKLGEHPIEGDHDATCLD
jgi:8-oxo-dGTP pyrophosphatase MutT (NUDIX family)